MISDEIFPLAAADQMVYGFIVTSLPPEEWTHEAHLITGLYHLAMYGRNTLPVLRLRIMRYNEITGRGNGADHGYHETLTVYWLWQLWRHLSNDAVVPWNQEILDALLLNEYLADRNNWLEYYTKNRMLSAEARKSFVEGDVKPSGAAMLFGLPTICD